MRLLELRCQPVGPLSKPVCFQCKKNCTIVYDENEAGKTSLVDIIVNMLYRKSSAQSRFQARRFDSFQGSVKLEHQGKTMTCKGSVDLDKLLGLPAEFSRLPIVRGSDLHFLWSGNREKNGPLIEACIQHFAADCEDNLGTVVTNVRSAAGLPAKRNSWAKGKADELRGYLDLYRKKEYLLSVMAGREETTRELLSVGERLQTVKDTLAAATSEQNKLQEEYQAALCSSARVWERKLSALRTEYRESGAERCSREDLQLWTETAARERSLREKEGTLKKQISDTETGLFDLRQQQEKVGHQLKKVQDACESARETLNQLRQKKEGQDKVNSELMAEGRALLNNISSAENQRNSVKWAQVTGIILIVAAVLIFAAGQLVPGGITLALGLGLYGWALTVSRACGRTIKKEKERVQQLARTADIHSVGTPQDVILLLERHLEKQGEEMRALLAKGEQECQEREDEQNKLVQENLLCERELDRLSERIRELQTSLTGCAEELEGVHLTLDKLMQRTGKPDFDSLESAIKERERMEREMDNVLARLSTLLGSEEQWRERLLALEPHLKQYPDPRSVVDLDRKKAQLETEVQRLRGQRDELQQRYDKLRQQELDESQSLYAAGCGDIATLALRLNEAEQALMSAIRESLAAIWVQKAVEDAREGFEETLLEPLSRAGEIFHYITGRYDTLDYTRQEGDVTFTVSQQGTTYSEDLLSDGAKAQLLLSLRLALLERILGEEPGFLVLDDPLLNSSKTRKKKAIQVLLDYAQRGWQLLYLTVDEAAVDIFQELGSELTELKKVTDFYVTR
ncbi:MAG: hypothetical protein PHV50_08845 [Syntrophaceticus sp.]|nr:hypothetical protein [Syntrophaceticus sp.]HBG21668.1 hypothetical protein [Peptococcaceae bacterium]